MVAVTKRPPPRRKRTAAEWTAYILAAAAAAALLFFAWFHLVERPRFDLVVRNTIVHDGTGARPFEGWIGVDGDTIKVVARTSFLVRPVGRTTIDAHGLDLSPGFIDTHTHADQSILGSSGKIRANNFVGQGVTTIVTGNCGRSPVDIQRFRDTIAYRRSNVNIATLVGANSIRREVMKDSTAPATAEETRRMCALVDKAMLAGAVGISTGPAYLPGRFASMEETIAELAVAARYGGIFTTHLRDEGSAIIEAVREATHQSKAADIPLLISHFKISGRTNCARYEVLDKLLAASGIRGLPVFTDQYPYTASSSNLDLYLPDWFEALHGKARKEILETPAGRARLTGYFRERLRGEGFGDFSFASVASYEGNGAWAGKNIAQIAAAMGRPATLESQVDVIVEMLRHGGAQMVYHNICDDLTLRIARRPTSMFGSDSAIRYTSDDYVPHPRGWGCFPRVFAHLVRGKQAIPLEEALRKMTSLPASVFGLDRRGIIRPGYYADLVVFDREAIADRATYADPFRPPRGIAWVVVNGEVVVSPPQSPLKKLRGGADVQQALPGRFLAREHQLIGALR